MEPRIEILLEKKLIGIRKRMSFSNHTPSVLWKRFMPRRKEVANTINTDLFSLEVYNNPEFFAHFNPEAEFEKWAAIEVSTIDKIPNEMESLIIPSELYAVFIHKGPASEAVNTFTYIFRNWLPTTEYKIDNRPHFAIIGEKYKHEEMDSEEEIWIPIALKTNTGRTGT